MLWYNMLYIYIYIYLRPRPGENYGPSTCGQQHLKSNIILFMFWITKHVLCCYHFILLLLTPPINSRSTINSLKGERLWSVWIVFLSLIIFVTANEGAIWQLHTQNILLVIYIMSLAHIRTFNILWSFNNIYFIN